MKFKHHLFFALLLSGTSILSAQEKVTNVYDLVKDQQGIVKEEASIMRQVASAQSIQKLIAEKPISDFFIFTEDRANDIRLFETIPAIWADRTAEKRNSFKGEANPGEYYVWQVGVYAPYHSLKNVHVKFSSLVNEHGDKIPARALECINEGGTDKTGKPFTKQIHVEKGSVQALWMGVNLPKEAKGIYKGEATISTADHAKETVKIALHVSGEALANYGDNEGWRKSRLHWLNSTVGNTDVPTKPYTNLQLQKKTISWLGGDVELNRTGLPQSIITHYNRKNTLDTSLNNPVLSDGMQFIIETANGEATLKPKSFHFTKKTATEIAWTAKQGNKDFEVTCTGDFGFDGIGNLKIKVKSQKEIQIKDIRLEVPYSEYASKYLMGLGHKGGLRPDSLINWNWNVKLHQDKIWMGNINAGMNLRFMDNNFIRPLVNIYYNLGSLNLPASWGNENKGGIRISPSENNTTMLTAYSGNRTMKKGEELHYNFTMQITPVKPIDFKKHVATRFYHPAHTSISKDFVKEAIAGGAKDVNIHHCKDIYPFINYPYRDQDVPDLKRFIDDAHSKNVGVRMYYTTRELTVKIPEIWALRSLNNEVIHDGPGKDARTFIHRQGPHEWLSNNFKTHFIPAWYNGFTEGKYAGDLDLSVITTPDSRWNNYYLAGLDWMVKHLGIDGVYIDDSALDRETIRRAKNILNEDGKNRLIDMHTWNHMNRMAGWANSIQIYTELLPYVDRTWIGEGFSAQNSLDFWLVEMSGIPFGLMSETLDAHNQFKGLVYCMLPRYGHSGDPVPVWNLFNKFGMEDATMYGFWDDECPVTSNNPEVPVTVYKNGDKALVVIANWSDNLNKANFFINEEKLGFKPSKFILPEIKNLQWGKNLDNIKYREIPGRSGLIVLIEK